MKAADIDLDFLRSNDHQNGYCDHIPHFEKLFQLISVGQFLECGCGYSTKYFADNSDHVTSIEFVNPGFGASWMLQCGDMYSELHNWTGIIETASKEIYEASCYRASLQKDYALIDDSYTKELFLILGNRKADVDVAFVDSGIYLRGDMVEVLLRQGVPIIVAHDYSENNPETYGWDKIKYTAGYEQIQLDNGHITSFWIRKELTKVIEGMKEYKKSLE